MSALWAVVATLAIVAAWDSIRRIFWARQSDALDARLKMIEDELPALREKAGDAEAAAQTVKNRLESQGPQRAGRWVR